MATPSSVDPVPGAVHRIIEIAQSIQSLTSCAGPIAHSAVSASPLFNPPLPESITIRLQLAGAPPLVAEQLSQAYQTRSIQFRVETLKRLQDAASNLAQLPTLRVGPSGSSALQQLYTTYETIYLKTIQLWADDAVNLATAQQQTCSRQRQRGPKFQKKWLPVFEFIYDQPNGKFPTRQDKVRLAKLTGMSFRQVSVWFQNRRSRDKKEDIYVPLSDRRKSAQRLSPVSDMIDDGDEYMETDLSSSESEESETEDVDQWAEKAKMIGSTKSLDLFQRSAAAWPCQYTPGSGNFDRVQFTTPWLRQPDAADETTASVPILLTSPPSPSNRSSTNVTRAVPPLASSSPNLPAFSLEMNALLEKLERFRVSRKHRNWRKLNPLQNSNIFSPDSISCAPSQQTLQPPPPTSTSRCTRKVSSSLSKKGYLRLAAGPARLPTAAIQKARARRLSCASSLSTTSQSIPSLVYSRSNSSSFSGSYSSSSIASSPEPPPHERLPGPDSSTTSMSPTDSLGISFDESLLLSGIYEGYPSDMFSSAFDMNVPTLTVEQPEAISQIQTFDHTMIGSFQPLVHSSFEPQVAFLDFDSLLRLAQESPPMHSPQIAQPHSDLPSDLFIPPPPVSPQKPIHRPVTLSSPNDFFQFLETPEDSVSPPWLLNETWGTQPQSPDTPMSVFETCTALPTPSLDFTCWLDLSRVEVP